ncbi:MAG: carboxylating nicotinate-nucleotide diphosphorylase [Sphingobacteriaceae bacterium]|nr:MAG: carboxylating nicotinate-nucleotide diphosphorylase [Pedobacter sp.]
MDLDKEVLQPFIRQGLLEDIGQGDHTSISTIPKYATGIAQLLVKERGVLAGCAVAIEIFKMVDSQVVIEQLITDGESIYPGDVVFRVQGSVHAILAAERLVLNTMQRMSGIATMTSKVVQLLKGTGTQVLDTRKTTPGMRYLEKMAVKIGGGTNHRFGLYDAMMIKDNHIDYAGGITLAVSAAHQYLKEKELTIPIVLEVRNLAELQEVLIIGGIDRILLDNFSYDQLKEAVILIDGKFKTEASGNITLDNVLDYAACGVNYVSMGALTHSVKNIDMSLKAIK